MIAWERAPRGIARQGLKVKRRRGGTKFGWIGKGFGGAAPLSIGRADRRLRRWKEGLKLFVFGFHTISTGSIFDLLFSLAIISVSVSF
jgi:hypothetical protein